MTVPKHPITSIPNPSNSSVAGVEVGYCGRVPIIGGAEGSESASDPNLSISSLRLYRQEGQTEETNLNESNL